jgi:nicotinate phosphoribosyltransferase
MGTWVTDENAALLTDLYELTMASSYFARDMNQTATFELFVRHLPEERRFLIACGIADGLRYLEELRFLPEAIAYLRQLGLFAEPFLSFLANLRFSGEVWAMQEGEAVFAEEPLLRVTAPLIEAQIVETFLLNCIGFQTLVASKAARITLAARGRPFVDFSPRRDHGADAALRGARAAFIGGASGTSNVLAGAVYGLPLNGTMAHSYVMAFDREQDAFRAFARDYGSGATLLIDTYDTLEGARRAVGVARQLQAEGVRIGAVRLDSGDLATLAGGVRRILDQAGFAEIRIVASGDLDEHRIAELLACGAPIDAFGVGTQLGTSADAPALGGVYKLVEDAHGLRVKLAAGKETVPGRKQVYRFLEGGRYARDVIALHDEPIAAGVPLLGKVMAAGRRLADAEPLSAAAARCAATLAHLPAEIRLLAPGGAPYPVSRSPALERALTAARGSLT